LANAFQIVHLSGFCEIGLSVRSWPTTATKTGCLPAQKSRADKLYWPDSALRKAVRPAAVRARIVKHIGWHTFRHSFATLLKANGEDVKVVQESLRHANRRITLDVYTQGLMPTKRRAQGRVVKSLLAPNGPTPATSVAASA